MFCAVFKEPIEGVQQMVNSKNLRTVILALALGALFGLTADGRQTHDGKVHDSATADTASETPSIDILNAKMPIPGVLVGGQPTPEQLEEAAQAGYRTVVNLRTEGEKGSWDESAKSAELGLRYVAIPVAGAGGLSEENAKAVAEVLNNPENLPAMVHCGSGNRVGAIFSLMAFHLDGEEPLRALELGLEAGLTSLEPIVREKLQLPAKE